MATKAAGGPDLHPQRQRRAETPVEDGEYGYFVSRWKRPEAGVPARPAAWGGKGRRKIAEAQPLPVRAGRCPIAL